MTGIVFAIREFTIHDGPGLRTTVFFKGCPLRCIWCHNPEGLSPQPELMVKEALCDHCGRCRAPCSHPSCRPFARCLHACPKGLVSVCGQEWEVEALAEKLKTYSDLPGDGGITFSGGEPLLQAEFIEEVCDRLPGLHKTLQTSGFAAAERFKQLAQRMDYLLFDLKLADPTAHIAYVGQSNEPILRNFNWLKTSGLPFTVRIPLIPGITDTADNLKALAAMTRGCRVELMPYNPMAGAKYPMVGRAFTYTPRSESSIDISVFDQAVLLR